MKDGSPALTEGGTDARGGGGGGRAPACSTLTDSPLMGVGGGGSAAIAKSPAGLVTAGRIGEGCCWGSSTAAVAGGWGLYTALLGRGFFTAFCSLTFMLFLNNLRRWPHYKSGLQFEEES